MPWYTWIILGLGLGVVGIVCCAAVMAQARMALGIAPMADGEDEAPVGNTRASCGRKK